MTVERGQGATAGRTGGGLTRDQVLDAGMQIVETEGIDQLTIRGLAGKLGVAATAIYWHVGDKRALLDGLAERVVAQLGEVSVRGRTPASRIISIVSSLREKLLERSDLVALVHRQGRTAALFQPARRVLVHELTGAGVEGRDAALAVRALLDLAIGSVLLDRQLERQPVQRETPEELWSREGGPEAPELLEHLSHPINEEQSFRYTLAIVVEAVLS